MGKNVISLKIKMQIYKEEITNQFKGRRYTLTKVQ